MNQRVKRTQRDYTLAFKQSVVDQVERGEISYKEAQRRYGAGLVASLWPTELECGYPFPPFDDFLSYVIPFPDA